MLVSELQKRLASERALSRVDALTALPNSRAFRERAEWLLAMARRTRHPITLAYLDLDNFKQVNDERGHQEGDRALKETAEVLKRQLRDVDLVARMGGDEFAVLLPETSCETARIALERVCAELRVVMQRNHWPVTASVGGVSYVRPPDTLDEAVRDADALMYQAKDHGKDRVVLKAIDLPAEAASAVATSASR